MISTLPYKEGILDDDNLDGSLLPPWMKLDHIYYFSPENDTKEPYNA